LLIERSVDWHLPRQLSFGCAAAQDSFRDFLDGSDQGIGHRRAATPCSIFVCIELDRNQKEASKLANAEMARSSSAFLPTLYCDSTPGQMRDEI
jgi:hypothetical protein